jgi:hypothetical protein
VLSRSSAIERQARVKVCCIRRVVLLVRPDYGPLRPFRDATVCNQPGLSHMPLPGDKHRVFYSSEEVTWTSEFAVNRFWVRSQQGPWQGLRLLWHARANVTLVARGAEALNATAEEIRRNTDVKVATSPLTSLRSGRAWLGGLPTARYPGEQRWRTAARRFPPVYPGRLTGVDVNMLTPIELIKATVDGMIARKFGRILNITSSAVKAPSTSSACPTARAAV